MNAVLHRTTGYMLTRETPQQRRQATRRAAELARLRAVEHFQRRLVAERTARVAAEKQLTAAEHVGSKAAARRAGNVAASPLTRPVDLVLHVGMGKTGTSALQGFLRDNRERLKELGLLFPATPGPARHERLGLFAKPDDEVQMSAEWARQKESDVAQFREEFRRRLISEIEDSGLSRVLLTDEVLFGGSERTLRRLGRFTDRIASSVSVVAYLRRQDDHMISRYQQGVKVGWVLRLRDWAQQDMSDFYDYYARLQRLERLLAATELVVRRYDPTDFARGSLYQDFLDAAGVDVSASDLEQAPVGNQTLDAESEEFLRLLNLYRIENEKATPGLIDNRRLHLRLVKASNGPVLSLPASELDTFMDQWTETNALVARRYLRDPSGKLFRAPRKTNVTTEQRLDPARLDHFFTVVDLPERLHGPLRRIAEREARKT